MGVEGRDGEALMAQNMRAGYTGYDWPVRGNRCRV